MKKAILKTLHYADIFDYPLTFEEIHRFLIKKHANKSKLQANLSKLAGSGSIDSRDGYYFLSGREDLVSIRRERKSWAQTKLRRAKRVATVLKTIPWIKMVGITGALAMGNSTKDDDIDLMFITAQDRLWLSRGLVVSLLRVLGLYRRPNKVKNRICPNVWVGLSNLSFSDRNLFTAHEIAQVKPLWERDNSYRKFINDNSWVKKYLPNWHMSESTGKTPATGEKRGFSFLDGLDELAFSLQLRYMRGRKTRERVEKNLALFHPRNTKSLILENFKKKSSPLRLDM